MKPVSLGEGELTGCCYALLFPQQKEIYIGSTKRGGSRLREHGDKLRGKYHPNLVLQRAYEQAEGYWKRHVILNVYGATNTELRNYEWDISIHLSSQYILLNDDTTTTPKFHLEQETMSEVVNLIDALMQISTEKIL